MTTNISVLVWGYFDKRHDGLCFPQKMFTSIWQIWQESWHKTVDLLYLSEGWVSKNYDNFVFIEYRDELALEFLLNLSPIFQAVWYPRNCSTTEFLLSRSFRKEANKKHINFLFHPLYLFHQKILFSDVEKSAVSRKVNLQIYF